LLMCHEAACQQFYFSYSGILQTLTISCLTIVLTLMSCKAVNESNIQSIHQRLNTFFFHAVRILYVINISMCVHCKNVLKRHIHNMFSILLEILAYTFNYKISYSEHVNVFHGTNSLFVLMCHKAVNQEIYYVYGLKTTIIYTPRKLRSCSRATFCTFSQNHTRVANSQQ